MLTTRFVAAVLAALTVCAAVSANDTTLTYQGRLDYQGRPYTGQADFRFTLWTAPSGGDRIGPEVTRGAVGVEDGLFHTELDFGSDAHGVARYLQIGVRTPPGSGPYSDFPERVRVTASPFSIRTRGIFVNGGGDRVGIGTDSPASTLQVNGGVRARTGAPGPGGSFNNGYAFADRGGTGLFNSIPQQLALYIDGAPRAAFGPGAQANFFDSTLSGITNLNAQHVIAPLITTSRLTSVAPIFLGGDTANSQLRINPDGRAGIRHTYSNVTMNIRGRTPEDFLFATELSDGSSIFQIRAVPARVLVFSDFSVINGSKNFVIDHPLAPATHDLAHNAVEGPGYYTFYRGNAVLDASGSAWVELPEYFNALNTDPTYHLTCLGEHAPVYVAAPVRNNRFLIAGGRPGMTVSWQVTGLRNDPFARNNPYQDVIPKAPDEVGRMHYPEGYGLPAERATSRKRSQED